MLTWLAAAVAFSLSMIVFSTIVSALTEFVHRLFHMREIGLRRMLEELYQQHLAPQLLDGSASQEKITAFSEKLTRNLAFNVKPPGVFAIFGYWFAPRRLQSLDWLEFVRRVAETDVGTALQQRSKPEIERIVNEMAVRFERFGADASAYFQERARAISITLALVVAIVLNVDAVVLFSTFLRDRALTEDVIARADKIVAAYDAQAKRTDEAVKTGEADKPAEAAGAVEAAPTKAEQTEDQKQLQAASKRVKEAMNSPLLAGLPIGFEVYPWCLTHGEKSGESDKGAEKTPRDPRCEGRLLDNKKVLLGWFFSVLTAGFLIGLGGPFWFKAYTKLASILGSARAATKGGDGDAEEGKASAPVPDAAPPGMHVLPVEAFVASLPERVKALPVGRALLARDGRRLG